jgi:hypothetical protein
LFYRAGNLDDQLMRVVSSPVGLRGKSCPYCR